MDDTSYTQDALRFCQPFFCEGVLHYTQKELFSPFHISFCEFRLGSVIDRNANRLFMKCVPDGCITVLFIQKGCSCKIELLGTPLAAKQLIVYPNALYFCARLEPGMKFPYSLISGSSLSTRDIVDTEIFLPRLNEDMEKFAQKLFYAPSFEKRIEAFYDYLKRFPHEQLFVNETLLDMLHRIYIADGNVNIKKMADEVCYSERQFSRIFSEALGYSPKTFARIVRLQHVLSEMKQLSKTGMEIAKLPVASFITGTDYSDQAHFQREFKDFTTLTPHQFAVFASKKGQKADCLGCAGRNNCTCSKENI